MRETTLSAIQHCPCGTIDGKPIVLFTIQNKRGGTLTFSNYGAAVQSLSVKDVRQKQTDVLLGYSRLDDYCNDAFYLGTVVGRCASRIVGETVRLGSESVRLTQKAEGYHHHGGRLGFNKKVWRVVDVGVNSIKMQYTSADGEEGYPGELTVTVDYTFDDDNNWIVDYSAVTDKPTFINLTQHAYFNLSGHDEGSILAHKLQIHAERYLPVNALLVPTGVLAPVEKTPFDFRTATPIGLSIDGDNEQLRLGSGYDHSWVLEESYSGELKQAATVVGPKTGITLNVFTTEPAVHFYSGNFLEPVTGKNGAQYRERSGFCLETQHFPDSPNHPHFPSIVLLPGEEFRSRTIFQFST
ncbi:aldose epimerase family protein [Flavisolibacter nicotianae]|uniref:aldose epimerase family protein n=1 Tax=Flavisolibacter nicotianae TaxID=2364882 RepID=UPI000EAF02AE|nr:aldose epimerase family protein [Flavisolibacter nicotianae]